MSQNHIKRIAIIGAGGQSGSYIAEALIAAGCFDITAITRPDSTNQMPEGLKVVKASYDDHSALVSALTGQDCLIVTLSVFAGPDTQRKLLEAAAEANVPWILPNEWGSDHLDEKVAKESLIGTPILAARQQIRDLGKSSYIAVVCSFWSYGFDFGKKHVTFFDKGETKLNTTTWPKVGQGVAALLSLPVQKEQGTAGSCLNDFKNGVLYVSSFRITQKEVFDSILRVTGDRESDWTVEYEDVQKRYQDGLKEMGEGKRSGFGKALYSRLFFPDAPADNQGKGKDHNDLLGLKQEDIDTRTKIAVDRFEKYGYLS